MHVPVPVGEVCSQRKFCACMQARFPLGNGEAQSQEQWRKDTDDEGFLCIFLIYT